MTTMYEPPRGWTREARGLHHEACGVTLWLPRSFGQPWSCQIGVTVVELPADIERAPQAVAWATGVFSVFFAKAAAGSESDP